MIVWKGFRDEGVSYDDQNFGFLFFFFFSPPPQLWRLSSKFN